NKIQSMQKDYKVLRAKYKNLKKDYVKYMTYVTQTRKDLQSAERELLAAAEHNEKVKEEMVDFPLSTQLSIQSIDTQNESVQCSLEDVSKSFDNLLSPQTQNPALGSVICDSGTFSLTAEGEKEGEFIQDSHLNNTTHEHSEESLLSSVMFEYRVVQRKHSLMEHDRKIGELLRSSSRSIICKRKAVRDCLQTNISAEENAISKEDCLQQCKTEGKKIIREMRKFKDQYNDIIEEKDTFENELLEITSQSLSTFN
ncbi:unnamed protein product, partial [Meganyctiphanes norvegica]